MRRVCGQPPSFGLPFAGKERHGREKLADEPLPKRGDKALDLPARKCANCARKFVPTLLRRMLCTYCFTAGRDY